MCYFSTYYTIILHSNRSLPICRFLCANMQFLIYNTAQRMQQDSKSKPEGLQEGEEQRPKRFRRSRKDCDQRTFICQSCSKSYLSNAALYTHVKNKHPDELTRNDKQLQIKIGEKGQKGEQWEQRPEYQSQANQSQNANQVIQQAGSNLEEIKDSNHKNQNMIILNDSEALEGLRQYLKKYYPERNKNCTIRLICEGLNPEVLAYIEPVLRQASEIDLLDVEKSELNINQVIGIFLVMMNMRVSSTCINFLIRFFFYFHYALVQETRKNDICQKENAYKIPNLFNSIVLHQRIPTPGFDEDQIMHNPIITCKVLHFFGNWLYEDGYTDYELQQNYVEQP